MSIKGEEQKRQLASNELKLRELEQENDLLNYKLAGKKEEIQNVTRAIESGKKRIEEIEREDRQTAEQKKRRHELKRLERGQQRKDKRPTGLTLPWF